MRRRRPRPSGRPGLSIHARLLLLVLAASVPLLLFAGVLLLRANSAGATLIEANALGDVRRLTLAVEALVGRAQASMAALAESPLLDAQDFEGFEAAAARLLRTAGLSGAVTVAGPDGTKLAHTQRTPGQPMPALQDVAGLHQVFATGKPQVSSLYLGQMTHEWQVAVHVPVVRDEQVRYDLVLAMPSDALAEALLAQGLPPGFVAVVADANGITVARTRNPAGQIGQPIARGLAALIETGEQGYAPVETRERERVFAAFRRSAVTGWTVAMAVPAALVEGPRLRSFAALASGGAALLLASAGLAFLVGRRIAGPVRALADQAARLGRNEVPDPAATEGVAETSAAGHALHHAATLLAARNQDRDAALLQAEESEARLLLAQEAGEIGSWEIDCATGRRTWSPQQFVLYGVDPSDGPPHGDAWAALVHLDDRARVLATMAEARTAPLAYHHEYRVLSPHRGLRWMRTAGRSLFRGGEPHRLIGISLDSTERHEAEAALREGSARLEAEVAARTRELAESEVRFRTYFENTAEALFVVRVEPDGVLRYETSNPAHEKLTGYPRCTLAGRQPHEVLPPSTAEAVAGHYRDVAATGVAQRFQHTVELARGTLDLDTVLMPVRDTAEGRITRLIGGVRDITEQRRMEARLSHAQRLEAVGQLTGGVAHDFNNLLTVVIGNLSLLRRRVQGDGRAERYLAGVEQAAERGARLTASLLAFSRRSTLQVAPLNVGVLVRESTTLLRRALGEEIALELKVAPDLPLATADTAQLEAAVLNLAINARDSMMQAMAAAPQRGGTLRITVGVAALRAADLEGNEEAKPGQFVAIAVQDTGTGMTKEVRARAFEPFFTTKDVGQGTGLGLSQVFGSVRQLGGHVTLDSEPGQGATATLFLPVAAPAPEPDAMPEAAPTPAAPPGKTILVVEDDDGIRDVTAELLRESGFLVLTAPDAPTALRILESGSVVDALFTDVVMPGGTTGVDLARGARGLHPALPVLLTSGYAGPALQRYGTEGEFDLLPKPYTQSVLIERLSQLVLSQPGRGAPA